MLKVVGFSTNPLKLETRAIHIAVPFIAQRRRRVEKVAQGVSPGYKAKTGSSPGGATQRLPRETLMCRASGARQHSSIFPSAYALGYFMPRLPALVRGGSLHPDSPEASYSCNPTLVFGPMRGS